MAQQLLAAASVYGGGTATITSKLPIYEHIIPKVNTYMKVSATAITIHHCICNSRGTCWAGRQMMPVSEPDCAATDKNENKLLPATEDIASPKSLEQVLLFGMVAVARPTPPDCVCT